MYLINFGGELSQDLNSYKNFLEQNSLVTNNLLKFLKHLKSVFKFFLFFFMILNNFDVLILKINFKKIKNIYYFKVFSNKKHFKKQSLPQF